MRGSTVGSRGMSQRRLTDGYRQRWLTCRVTGGTVLLMHQPRVPTGSQLHGQARVGG